LVYFFIVVQGFLAYFHWDIFFILLFAFFYHLSLSLFSSSENRSSRFIRSLPRQTRPLSFLAFSDSFSGKNLRQLG
jgi:hypothetical protein